MRALELGELLLIAEAVTGLPATHLRHEVKSSLAEAALRAPFTGFGEVELFPLAHEKIGVLGFRLATYHPFADGNKRTAWVAMRMMASLNGLGWRGPARSDDESVEVMWAVAAGEMPEPELIAWIEERLSPGGDAAH